MLPYVSTIFLIVIGVDSFTNKQYSKKQKNHTVSYRTYDFWHWNKHFVWLYVFGNFYYN